MSFEARIGWRYLYGGKRDRVMAACAGGSVLVTLIGLALVWHSGGASTVGAVATVIGLLATAVFGMMSTFSVFTSVSTLGVAVGVAALTIVLAVTTGFQDEFRTKVLGGRAHITVVSEEGLFSDYEHVMAKAMSADHDIIGAQPFLYTEMLVTRGKGELSGVVIKGIDPARVGSVFELAGQVVQGSLSALGAARPDGARPPIVIGIELAHKLKAKLGDPLTVVMPLTDLDLDTLHARVGGPKTKVFQIAGIFYSGFDEYDRRFAYASLADTQALVGCGDQVHGIEMKVRDPDRADDIAREIDVTLDQPFQAQDWYEQNHNLFLALNIQKLALVIILTLIIAVAAFNMVSALTMMVTDKTREIAILKSMGASSTSIARVFQLVGLAIGTVGTLVGMGVGLVICRVVSMYGYRLDARVYMIDKLPIVVRPTEVLLVAAVTLAISILATVVPAASAAALTPVEGLRYD